MRCKDAVRQIFDRIRESEDRYAVHAELRPIIARLCTDREFLHDAIRHAIIKTEFLERAQVLSLPILLAGLTLVAYALTRPVNKLRP